MIEVPVCPDCGEPLEMLDRYLFAPSIAWCLGCLQIVNVQVVYREVGGPRWDVLSVEPLNVSGGDAV